MELPLVSVIMSAFNEEEYIGEAVNSILRQTYQNFELLIIDDYSTDRTLDICRGFTDPRIRIFEKTNEPKFLPASRNIGVDLARGEYIIFQDADDLSDPRRIELQLTKALENPGGRIVGCSIIRIEGSIERRVTLPERHHEIIRGFLRNHNRITIVSGLILAPMRIMRDIRYKTQLRYFEDWDHMLRLFESGRVEFYNCQEPLYRYYIRSKGSLYQKGWINDNIYVRHCQMRRRSGLKEFDSPNELSKYLRLHPSEWFKWWILKQMILLNRYLYLRKVSAH